MGGVEGCLLSDLRNRLRYLVEGESEGVGCVDELRFGLWKKSKK